MLQRITESDVRNYSIFLCDGILFSYFEYDGEDYALDMAKMAADTKTRGWAIIDPMQCPWKTHADGEWWASMQEVFHMD